MRVEEWCLEERAEQQLNLGEGRSVGAVQRGLAGKCRLCIMQPMQEYWTLILIILMIIDQSL